MRSTLAASSGTTTGWRSVARRVSGIRSDSATMRPTRSPTSVGSSFGATMPRGQPVEVEQVHHEPVEATRVVGDAVGEIPGVVLGQVHVAALERDRESEDRRQRCAQVVGDRLQERVLHLVEGPQALRRLAFDGQRAFELLLGLLALGDVEEEALPVGGLAGEMHEDGLVLDPDDPAVLRDHPVLEGEALVRVLPVALRVRREDALPIVGVRDLPPQRGIGDHLVQRVAEHVGVAGRDVGRPGDGRVLRIDLLRVEDGLVLFDDRAELELRLPQLLLGLLALGDVEHEPLPEALAVRLGDERGLVVHPDPTTVGRPEPELTGIRRPSSDRPPRRARALPPGRRGGCGRSRSPGSRSIRAACTRRATRPAG